MVTRTEDGNKNYMRCKIDLLSDYDVVTTSHKATIKA